MHLYIQQLEEEIDKANKSIATLTNTLENLQKGTDCK